MRRREHGDAAAGRLHRQRPVAHRDRHTLGLQPVCRDLPQRAVGVVIGDLRTHVVARLTIGRRGDVEPRVVVIGDVGIVGGQHRFLLNQAAGGVERVGQSAVEAAHAQAVEDDLDAFADAARRRAAERERALHVPGPLRVARRIVEERVPAAPALPRLALVERAGAADDRLALGPDGGHERLGGVERERRAPDPCRLVRPRDRHRAVAANDVDGTGLHPGEIDRHRHRGRLHGNEHQQGKAGDTHVRGRLSPRAHGVRPDRGGCPRPSTPRAASSRLSSSGSARTRSPGSVPPLSDPTGR